MPPQQIRHQLYVERKAVPGPEIRHAAFEIWIAVYVVDELGQLLEVLLEAHRRDALDEPRLLERWERMRSVLSANWERSAGSTSCYSPP